MKKILGLLGAVTLVLNLLLLYLISMNWEKSTSTKRILLLAALILFYFFLVPLNIILINKFDEFKFKGTVITFLTNKHQKHKKNDSEFVTYIIIIVTNYLAFPTWRHCLKSLEYANFIR